MAPLQAEAPAAIKALFADYSDNGIMTIDHFHRFLIEIQKQLDSTRDDAIALFQQIGVQAGQGLDLYGFFKYISDDLNSPLPLNRGVHHDMNAPLSQYFVFTGHNSYLTGNQLSSDSSDAPIIDALKRGVRVIELDIWPSSSGDDVHVYHGRTLTSHVELIRCLKSIKEYAFIASDYPVIITLEDHLTPDLQAKVAEMVTQTFGDILFTPGLVSLKEFPSPELLKKRILISTKPPKEYLEGKEIKKQGDMESEKSCHIQADDKNEPDEDSDDEEDGDINSSRKVAPEYKHIITIHAGKPKGGLDVSLKVDSEKVRRLSLSEEQLEDAAETHGREIVRFTQRNILRVYPKGIRVNSSNYNPLIGWMHGAQMVAFNMQGHGRSLWLMHGMFKSNGGCGYVKKPEFLLKSGPHGEVFDPRAELPVKITLKVKVYMGDGWHNDFHKKDFEVFSKPDFYVRVGIVGVPADSKMKKTETVDDNWRPVWDEEFQFPLTVPELALLQIVVNEHDMSEKDDFGGQTCLPISELQRGVRAVPLHDRDGVKFGSVKLLMHFDFV
ncbi:hypothetical protein DM860_008408 [Cuscuta australis]|uniref:Phosphoinositide phospholipase C n=1 Tax=Cuscuta australis TaxID=267555 RepID=A0A328D6E1_9ASTE|nr:hypothetical protein DM860_008408 [Cuscuta australis]